MTTALAPAVTTASATAQLFMTDAYKLGHRQFYPKGTTRVLSNFTNRGTRIPGVDKVIHFGLQYFLQWYCIEEFVPFFAADADEAAAEYEARVNDVLGENAIGSDHIRALHAKGHLPLVFRSVPEGTRVPVGVPTFTVESTDPEFFWLVNYIETVLSSTVWHPSTTATQADHYRTILDAAAAATGTDPAFVNYQMHDFSFRGLPGAAAAAASGAAHLLSFTGSDNLATMDFIRRYYPGENGHLLGSVPATEHAVMCAGGRDNELGTYRHLLQSVPTGPLSIVSDTWSLWEVLLRILPELKDEILARDGKVVIRPDSGNPADIICGTGTRPDAVAGAEAPTIEADPEFHGALEILWATFGGSVNANGYKILDPHFGLIYGDSITFDMATEIFGRMEKMGFSTENIILGVGSYTYQYVTRDTFSSAIKVTWAEVDGEARNMMKDPITAKGSKRSATGRLAVTLDDDGELVLIEKATPEQEAASLLQSVWANGEFIRRQSFADVRAVVGNIAP